ncbi:MAG: hypothetical protein AB1656_15400 [Candidatus Omnitrophota bacterium]
MRSFYNFIASIRLRNKKSKGINAVQTDYPVCKTNRAIYSTFSYIHNQWFEKRGPSN